MADKLNSVLKSQCAIIRAQAANELEGKKRFSDLLQAMTEILSALEAQDRRKTPTFTEAATRATFKVGSGASVTAPIDFLRTHHITPFKLSPTLPVAYVKGDRLFVDVDIWAGTGHPAIQLRNNQVMNKPLGWDLNSNDRALEVVNEENSPVFQIIYESDTVILLKGLLDAGGGNFAVVDDSGIQVTDMMPPNFHLTRLFRYPAWRYPEQLAPEPIN